MSRPFNSDAVLSQIRSCLDAAASRPELVRATVHQTEGYLIGIQGLTWQAPAETAPSEEDPASLFLHDVRQGAVPLRGRVKKESTSCVASFFQGLVESFPESEKKPFSGALARLWVRWSLFEPDASLQIGRRVGGILKQEYEEGLAGELSAYLLDDRIHLRRVRDYLRMRGWLQGMIEFLRRKPDWENRERAEILASNFSSVILRSLHSADLDYAVKVVAELPSMIRTLDRGIENLSAAEPEAVYFLRNNRLTILTHALHSGYLDYPERAARELPEALKKLNRRIADLELSSPEDARNLRGNVASSVYRALTNGKLDTLDKSE